MAKVATPRELLNETLIKLNKSAAVYATKNGATDGVPKEAAY